MISYGTRSKTKSGGLIDGIDCPSCENQKFHSFGIIKFFHISRIPTFPTGKLVGIECTHCKRTLTDKELPSEVSDKIRSSLFSKKDVLPLYAGLLIIALAISYFGYSFNEQSKQEAIYIEQPAVNDLYVADFSKLFEDSKDGYKYGLLRVNVLSSEQVGLQVSNVVFNKTKGVFKDIRNESWSSDTYFADQMMYIDREALKDLKETGAIRSITRPE